jgi:uncharacterized protein YbjT (DUF2867 family)
LGSATARRLLARERVVRVMTRTPQKATALGKLGAEVVQDDLLDKASLARACRGATKVLAAAHSILGRGKEASKYVDLQGHKDLIDAARKAGVEHFVYMSAYKFNGVYDDNPFFQIKYEVEGYLRASGLDYTILRPTHFMESHAERFIGQPIMETGKVTLFGRGENRRNFIAADDVAQIVVRVLEDPAHRGEIIDVCGTDNPTNLEIVGYYEEQLGRPVKVSHVPLAVLKVMYRLIRPFHPGLSQIMHAAIIGDTTDQTFDPTGMLERFPMDLVRVEDFVRERAGKWQTAPAAAGALELDQA